MMRDIGEIKDGALLFGEEIEWLGTTQAANEKLTSGSISPDKIIDARGKTIIPGFVDSHTHIVFAGSRANEFARRLRGATYREIAESGGGIQTTVKATREASIEELVENGRMLALSALKHGTTAIEIKSGYGLSIESEMKMLRAIKILKQELPIHVSATFMGAHDFPPEYKDNHQKYVDLICNEMLPAVAAEGLAEYCDAFVDQGYYTIAQAEKIMETACNFGMKIKMHCDELACVGAAELAGKLHAASADHLLYISDEGIQALKESGTVATLLPGTAYFIRLPYAPARKLIDAGAIVALATDCNPGSCFTENMQLILSLAVINMQMTAEEALTAATLNGAAALGLSDSMGSLEAGKKANFLILDVPTYEDLFYHFGINHVEHVFVNGRKVV